MALEFGEATWKTHWKIFDKGMKMHMMYHVKVCSSTTYHILLYEYGELPIELHTLKFTLGFQQRLTHLSYSWLVSKATSLSRHLAKHGFYTWHKLTTMWKTSWSLSHWDTLDNPTTSKIAYDDVKEAFHTREWNSFHLSGKKLDYLHL